MPKTTMTVDEVVAKFEILSRVDPSISDAAIKQLVNKFRDSKQFNTNVRAVIADGCDHLSIAAMISCVYEMGLAAAGVQIVANEAVEV